MLSEYFIDGGLVTLSRFPIIESDFMPYPLGVLSDQSAYKGVLYTKIDINGYIIHLFQSHT